MGNFFTRRQEPIHQPCKSKKSVMLFTIEQQTVLLLTDTGSLISLLELNSDLTSTGLYIFDSFARLTVTPLNNGHTYTVEHGLVTLSDL